MKLNLWMIANRLSDYDIEVKVEEKAEAVIDSALPFKAPGCVYVYSTGNDLMCECEQGWIRIRDVGKSDGYLLIQDIINWYQSLLEKIDRAIMENHMPELAKLFAELFGNPVLLQDPNFNLLAMEEGTDKEIPPEWEYVKKHGHISVEGYAFMSNSLRFTKGIYRSNVRSFHGKEESIMPYGGLHASISFQGNTYGKLTVLETQRKLNYGDVRVMEYLANRMAIYLAAISGNERRGASMTVIESLIAGEYVPEGELAYYERIIGKNLPGIYAVLLIEPVESEGEPFHNPDGSLDIRPMIFLKNKIFQCHPSLIATLIKGQLLVLLHSAEPMILARQLLEDLNLRGWEGRLRLGLSSSFYRLSELSYFFEQAMYAQRYSEGELSDFYSLALSYLMEKNGKARYYACDPTLRHMWEDEEKRMYLKTLEVYIAEERSATRAAARLFIHKNTLTYRIKYLKEHTEWNLDDSYTRDYLRLSMYILGKENV